MTTSEYLKVQADLLIAARIVRTIDLDTFLDQARALDTTGEPLVDHRGSEVQHNAATMVGYCLGAIAFRDCVRRFGPGRAAASEQRKVAAA